MPLKIHKLFNTEYEKSEEVKQANNLACLLENSLSNNLSGDIYIMPSMTCPQARNKDLDLVVWIDMKDEFEINVKTGIQGSTLPINRSVKIKDALLIFEIKKHNEYSSIKIENQKIHCLYPEGFHDVSSQSNGQKVALINFLNERVSGSPFVVNLIWLHRAESANHYDAHQVDNVIWGQPTLNRIFEVVFRNNLPKLKDGIPYYRSSVNDKIANDTTAFFEVLRKNTAVGIGRISRKKVHELIQKDISEFEKNYFNSIGAKLTSIHGNPGTGKTIHLIHLAKNLHQKRDLKCIILTFNKALQQDIKRLLYYSGLAEANQIYVQTFDAFVYKCLQEYPDEINESPDFEAYTNKLYELIKYVERPRELFSFPQKYDCVLIDEGQDWSDAKKQIVFKLFGYQYTVAAIGENQLVENNIHQNWGVGFNREERQKFTLEVSHRNKINIVEFLSLIGENYNWELINNKKLPGGKVIVTTNYSYNFHSDLIKDLQENENSLYDMMFLGGTNEKMDEIENIINSYGHKAFVANRKENRNQMFPLNQFRVLSYQACRGLEAWTVVCFEWDEFILQLMKIHQFDNIQKAIESFNLIVMTRAIDTLVITLKDPNSEVSQQLIKTARQNPGLCRLME
jgi:hypothetical protein